MKRESVEYLNNYKKVSEEVVNKIEKHCNRYNIKFDICAYYYDWYDFCYDWCDDQGYTRTEARKLLHGGQGEFMIIKDYGIVRFSI